MWKMALWPFGSCAEVEEVTCHATGHRCGIHFPKLKAAWEPRDERMGRQERDADMEATLEAAAQDGKRK